jgi:hypothetical protein
VITDISCQRDDKIFFMCIVSLVSTRDRSLSLKYILVKTYKVDSEKKKCYPYFKLRPVHVQCTQNSSVKLFTPVSPVEEPKLSLESGRE